MAKPGNNLSRIAILIAVNFVPSVVVPAIFDYYDWMSRSEAVLFGVLIWILFTTGEALYKIDENADAEKHELVLWNIQNEFDTRLSNIREAHRKILTARRDVPDLFQSFFDDRAAELEKSIVEAANRDELHLERSHVVSFSVLMGSFKGDPEDILRAVHLFEDNVWFFGIYAKGYFYQMYDLVKQKKVKAVKRLMLYKDDAELQDPKSIRLMKFHALTSGYSYKVMHEDAFRSLVRDYRLEVARDFGIYGNKYLYMAQINRADNLIGYWVKNPATLATYIKFFDNCWNSPVATTLKTIDTSHSMTIEELFEEPI